MTESPVVKEALERLKIAQNARKKQLDREKAALKFQVPELQWDEDMRRSRQAQVIDGVQIPARPMLSIPKLNQPIQLVLNQEKAAHLGVNISPLSEDADDDTAEVMRDLYRRIEQDSRAGLARSWAFDRAVKAGTGCYRINTKYDDDSTNPTDQKIVFERLLYQDAAYFDPAAQEPDWCDGEWALVLSWLPHEKYKRLHPRSALAEYEADELKALAEEQPEWVTFNDEGKPACLVAEYWRKEYSERQWVILDDGSFAYEDEIPEGRKLAKGENARLRKVSVPQVKWSKINAVEELESEDWNGKYIPLIPVVGEELQPFDGERRWRGIIEPSMDAQRLFNYAASSAVELAALEPKAPYVMYEGQDEGYETMWQQANIRNFPSLKVSKEGSKGPNGEMLPPPQRTQTDVGKLGPSMLLLDKAEQFIQAGTTTLDQSRIEQMGKRRVAHQTISALQEQSDLGTSHFLHNLATISMPYEAKVVIDLMAKIYDRPGRVARLLDMEDNERTVLLNQPFTTDQKGRPVPVQDGQRVDNVKNYDLRKGVYGVTVSIGKSWQSRLQQGADELGQILTASPELMPLIGATYFKFRDFPGAKEVAKVLKKVREKQFPGIDNDEGQADPEQLQAELAAAKEQMQQMQSALQQAQQIIETDKAKQAATLEKARLDNATKEQIERIEAANKLHLQELEHKFELLLEQMKMAHEEEMARYQAAHDAAMARQAGAQDAALAERGHQHKVVEGEQGHRHALEQGEQGHRAAIEQTTHAAKVAPKPKEKK